MPRTLYRYIGWELLKLLAAATAVLVAVMSFGSAIKPLSEGLLGPWQLARFVLYAMPGMLTFALPFAAALAGTLVFFRMAADNEITACAVGGVSYMGLLGPVLVLGLALTVGLFALSNWVVPTFWRLVEQEIEHDVASLVVRQVGEGRVVEMGRLVLYADRAMDRVPIEPRPPGEPAPYNRIVLDGPVVGRADQMQALYTARRAVVDLYRDAARQRIFATMMLSGVTVIDPESGQMVWVRQQAVKAQEIPSPLRQRPKFMSLPQLRALDRNPMLSAEVREAKRRLTEALAHRQLLRLLRERLSDEDGPLELSDPQGRRYLVRSPAAELTDEGLRLSAEGAAPADTIEVRLMRAGPPAKASGAGPPARASGGGEPLRRMEAETGLFEIEEDQLGPEPRITLRLGRVRIFDPRSPTANELREVVLPLLDYPRPMLEPMQSLSLEELAAMARADDAEPVRRQHERFARTVNGLVRDVVSRLHERAATAVNCVLVLTLGAVMSMVLRRRVPLVIFFFCFVPTVAAILSISQGQKLIQLDEFTMSTGIAVAWSGNAALAALILGVYLKLRRN